MSDKNLNNSDSPLTGERLMSIDALRGFDMFWIIGGATLWVALCDLFTGAPGSAWALQMDHVDWGGMHFIDFIFPVFLFITGLSFPFSYSKQVARGDSSGKIHKKVIRRMITLMLLGLAYNGFFETDWTKLADFRYFSVLGKIGFAWGIAALIYMHTGLKARLGWMFGGLIVYAVLLGTVTAPDAPAGVASTSLEGCFVGYLDRLFTPGYLYCDNIMEPSGPFVSFFGYSTALLGMCGGDIVRSKRWAPVRKAQLLALIGVSCLALGLAFSPISPIVKKLWSPTFALVASGTGYLFFSLFYYIIDVRGCRSWCYLLRIIGMNAITIYMLTRIVNFTGISNFFFKGFAGICGPLEFVVCALGVLCVKWLLLHFLYRHKVFLKV